MINIILIHYIFVSLLARISDRFWLLVLCRLLCVCARSACVCARVRAVVCSILKLEKYCIFARNGSGRLKLQIQHIDTMIL